MDTFKAGDIVMLKSGGMKMTIVDVIDKGESGVGYISDIPANSLRIIKEVNGKISCEILPMSVVKKID